MGKSVNKPGIFHHQQNQILQQVLAQMTYLLHVIGSVIPACWKQVYNGNLPISLLQQISELPEIPPHTHTHTTAYKFTTAYNTAGCNNIIEVIQYCCDKIKDAKRYNQLWLFRHQYSVLLHCVSNRNYQANEFLRT